jgi:hypothetical protein
MINVLRQSLSRIFKSPSNVNDNVFDEHWDWDEGWSSKKENRDQWDFYTIYIFIKEQTLIDQIVRINKKYSIVTPYLHITLHYPFTIKDGFSEDDILRVLTHFLSEYDSPIFSIQDTLWLHKNRYKTGNIIALGIEQSGDFEKIRIGITNALHPYIIATAPYEKEPQYKTKARPHISIAYRLDYHAAKLLSDNLIKQQRDNTSNAIFATYPLTTITLGKKKTFFDFDFKEKSWKQ